MLSAFPSLLFSVVNAERGLSLIFALLVLLVWGEKKKNPILPLNSQNYKFQQKYT